jgi:hypothetical protein
MTRLFTGLYRMGRLTAPQVTKSTGSSRFTIYYKAKRVFYNLQSVIFCVTAFEIFRLGGPEFAKSSKVRRRCAQERISFGRRPIGA